MVVDKNEEIANLEETIEIAQIMMAAMGPKDDIIVEEEAIVENNIINNSLNEINSLPEAEDAIEIVNSNIETGENLEIVN